MLKKRTKKEVNEKHLAIKMLICLLYLMVITILIVCAYRLYQEKIEIKPWSEVSSTEDYTYIEISKMSEKFAYYEKENIGIHFVIEKEDTGRWHTYLIAINENDYDKYKKIIDYSYDRTKEIPETIKVYGYPVITNENLKEMTIKNIENFIPAENEVQITSENYDDYLTNSYLDTTLSQKEEFSLPLTITYILLIIIVILLIITVFDKGKIIEQVEHKSKKIFFNLKNKIAKRK